MTPRRPTSPSGARGAPRPRQPAATGSKGSVRPAAPSARPALHGRQASKARPRPAARPGSRRPALGRPVTVVAGVAVVLAVLITPYLRPWLHQRSELAGLSEQIAQSRQDVSSLQAERLRWEDPAYVRAQARQRLNFVLPGETGYVLTGDITAASKPVARPKDSVEPAAGEVWFGKLWTSVQVAGATRGR